ncbi:hypothetical protein WA577_002309 [Blastocystis sp. JDR]
MRVMKKHFATQIASEENIEIVPKKPSKYFVNVGEADVQNAIQQFYSDLLEKTNALYVTDVKTTPALIFINPSKTTMLPSNDKNADAYYYNYYFFNNNENTLSTYFIASERFIFIDISAGPIVVSSDVDDNNIHNTIPYSYLFDRSLKSASIVSTTKFLLQNVLFTNIVNATTFAPQQQLLTSIVFFTDADEYSPRLIQYQQELEEVKIKLRGLFKTHMRTRRAHLVTDMVNLRTNVTLLNSIRSTYIESISLYNGKSSIEYEAQKHIDGHQLESVLKLALATRDNLFNQHHFPTASDASSMFSIFVLDVKDMKVVFEGNLPYFFSDDAIIVIRSESSFPRGYSTEPDRQNDDNHGDRVANFVVSALFEGFVGMENFGKISANQETRFVLPLGHSPFQYNDPVSVSKLFSDVYQRNQLLLLLNTIMDRIEVTFHQINKNFYTILGNPIQNSSVVITREFLSQYYRKEYPSQQHQYQQLFLDIVNLCNQFSYYIGSFMDIDFQMLRADSQSDQLQLVNLLKGLNDFQQFSKELMSKYVSIAQCSEIKYSIKYSSDISVEVILCIVFVAIVCMYVVNRYFF